MPDIIRVLRVIEYVGERDIVEKTVASSIHGTLRIGDNGRRPSDAGACMTIRAATIGAYPEVLETEEAK